MKLLFSISYYSPYVSGLTLYVKRLAEELEKKDFQISVISNRYKPGLKSEEKINGVRVIRAKPILAISKGFLSLDFVSKSVREVKLSDTVIVNLPQFEGFIPAIIGKLTGKKVFAIYHCEVKLPSGIINYFLENCLNFANSLSLFLADAIITYTRDFAGNSRTLRVFDKKVKTIYPPIYRPVVDKRVQKIIREKIGKKSFLTIGVAARLAAEKGIEYLLEAIPILKKEFRIQNSEFRILIAGSMDPVGEEKYKEKIMQLVEKYKNYLVFLRELKEEEMGAYYSLLDVLVLPSVNSTEAFGMVQVEAMMCGVPVIATNLPGVRVPVGRTGMGLVVPARDSGELASAIYEVINNREKYLKESKIIEREFSINKTIKFYENLLVK